MSPSFPAYVCPRNCHETHPRHDFALRPVLQRHTTTHEPLTGQPRDPQQHSGSQDTALTCDREPHPAALSSWNHQAHCYLRACYGLNCVPPKFIMLKP